MSIDWEFNLGFERIKEETAARIDPALLVAMEYVKTVVTPIAPIETGNLRASGDVGIGVLAGGEAAEHVAHLYYPGPYALYVHEGVFYRYGKFGAPLNYQSPGEPCYLIRPMVQEGPTAIRIVKKELGL